MLSHEFSFFFLKKKRKKRSYGNGMAHNFCILSDGRFRSRTRCYVSPAEVTFRTCTFAMASNLISSEPSQD